MSNHARGTHAYHYFQMPTQVRNLNLLEYQSKKLLDEGGVAIQKFRILDAKNDGKVLEDFSERYFAIIHPVPKFN